MKKRKLLTLVLLALLLGGCSGKGTERYLREVGANAGYENAFSQLTQLSEISLDGSTFLRCQQNYKDIPVWHRNVICVTDEKGDIITVTGNPLDVSESLSLIPTATADQVHNAISDYLGDQTFEMPGEDALYIYNMGADGQCHLAYCLYTPEYELLIDAHSGELLKALSTVYSDDMVELDLKGQKQSYDDIPVYKDDSGYSLYDPERNITIWVTIPSNASEIVKGNYPDLILCEWSDEGSAVFPDMIPVAIDGYVNTRLAYDYFATVLSHRAPDRQGNTKIEVLVADYSTTVLNHMLDNSAHTSSKAENLTRLGFFAYQSGGNTSRALDSVTHEYAHAVEQMTTGLIPEGESGAIMEALSDIFGELATTWHSKMVPDWIRHNRLIASPITSKNPVRYQGLHWGDTSAGNDRGNVHQNSTVLSHAAYLMSTDGGGLLSYDQLARLWYRAMLMMSPDCDFIRCRECVEWAALTMDELSAAQRQCISDAFDTVCIPTASIRIAPGGELTVVDRSGAAYDNYTIEIYRLDSKSLLTSDEASFTKEVKQKVTTDDPFVLDLDAGFHYVILTDNTDTSRAVRFDLTLWPEAQEEYCFGTNFGYPRIGGFVSDGAAPLSGVEVTLNGDTTQTVVTDEDGHYTIPLKDPSLKPSLTFRKDGYCEDTRSVTITPGQLSIEGYVSYDVVLHPEVHPYAEVIREYEAEFGTVGYEAFSGGIQTITGVFYLELLDFNDDGVDELVMGYGDGGADYTNYHLQVWTLRDNEAVLIYQGISSHGSDISRWFELTKVDGVWYVGEGYDGYETDLRYYGMVGDGFSQLMRISRAIEDTYYAVTYYTVNGTTVAISEYNAQYKRWLADHVEIDCLCYSDENRARHAQVLRHTEEVRSMLGVEDEL